MVMILITAISLVEFSERLIDLDERVNNKLLDTLFLAHYYQIKFNNKNHKWDS